MLGAALFGLGVYSSASSALAEELQSGMRVYVDPTTGKFIEAPAVPDIAHQPRSGRAADTVVQVVPGTTSAGGVLAQIPPSLGAEVKVVVQPDGHLTTECHQGPSAGQ